MNLIWQKFLADAFHRQTPTQFRSAVEDRIRKPELDAFGRSTELPDKPLMDRERKNPVNWGRSRA